MKTRVTKTRVWSERLGLFLLAASAAWILGAAALRTAESQADQYSLDAGTAGITPNSSIWGD